MSESAANRQEFDVIEVLIFLDPPETKKHAEREAENIVQMLTRRGYDARLADIRGPEVEDV